MRLREIGALFLMLLVIMAVLSIPLWWDFASPYIFRLPRYITGIINDIKGFIDIVLKSL
ncbi:MAG: hypothetical protein Q7J35_01410 [Candidatus Methanoperedens sp.]|nr:hypothetical protein [Candidatus Methanoperedens sp.]